MSSVRDGSAYNNKLDFLILCDAPEALSLRYSPLRSKGDDLSGGVGHVGHQLGGNLPSLHHRLGTHRRLAFECIIVPEIPSHDGIVNPSTVEHVIKALMLLRPALCAQLPMNSSARRVFLNPRPAKIRQIQLRRSQCSQFPFSLCRRFSYVPSRPYSSRPHSTPESTNITLDANSHGSGTSPSKRQPPTIVPQKQKQTMTERDAHLLEKMRDAMGGSDLSNVEMEDGVPDRGMKRNVRENMFGII
jgi:hypothetical protein